MPLYTPNINVTLSGNSTSAGAGYALLSSGTLTLAGGNNITLSQNGNAVTISGGAGGAFSGGISTDGNTSGTTGLVSNQLLLVGGSNVTLSQSVNAGSATLTISARGFEAGISTGGNTSGVAIVAQRQLVLAGGNNVTLSGGGNVNSYTVTISAAAGISAGISTNGNTAGTTGLYQSRMLFHGGNNITLSQSVNGQSGTLSIIGPNTVAGISAGISTNGNTSGTTGFVQSQMLFVGGNNVTLSQSVNGQSATLTISAGAGGGAFSAGINSQGNTAGTTGLVQSQMHFFGGNNVTLSQSVNGQSATLSIIGGAGGAFSAGVSTDGNTEGTTGMVGNQIVFVGAENVTLSQSVNGQSATVSMIAPTVATLSFYEPYPFVNTGTGAVSLASNTSAQMSLYRFNVVAPVLAEYVGLVVSMSFTTGGTSSFRQSGTLQWGIYSNLTGTNSTRLSLMGSNSLSYAVTYNNSTITIEQATTTNLGGGYGTGQTTSAGLNITSGYTGLKLLLLGLNSTITRGDYWFGIHHRNSSSSFNSGIRMSLYGRTHTVTGLAPMGSYSSAYTSGTAVPGGLGGNWLLAQGSYSVAAMTALTNDVTMSQISANLGLIPFMKFATRV